MKSIFYVALMTAAAACAAALSTHAEVTAGFGNTKVVVLEHEAGDHGYWTTTSDGNAKPLRPDSVQIRDDMMHRRVLEEYAEFISPLRLLRTLRVIASDCDGNAWDSPHYNPYAHWMNMCYSWSAAARKTSELLAQRQSVLKLPTPVSADQILAGAYAAVLMHETGHALFDLLDVPVFGREEDAADQIAAFIALQFDRETARTVIKGFAYYWFADAVIYRGDPGALDPNTPNLDRKYRCQVDAFCGFSDMHGSPSQRMFNVLCLAYGGQPQTFQDLVDSKWLPQQRAAGCKREYDQVYYAFAKTIYPFIDQGQMKKVQARPWFQPKELREK